MASSWPRKDSAPSPQSPVKMALGGDLEKSMSV